MKKPNSRKGFRTWKSRVGKESVYWVEITPLLTHLTKLRHLCVLDRTCLDILSLGFRPMPDLRKRKELLSQRSLRMPVSQADSKSSTATLYVHLIQLWSFYAWSKLHVSCAVKISRIINNHKQSMQSCHVQFHVQFRFELRPASALPAWTNVQVIRLP